jgi:hypothetical protein
MGTKIDENARYREQRSHKGNPINTGSQVYNNKQTLNLYSKIKERANNKSQKLE